MNNYIDKTNMIGLGMVCDNCGRTVQGITYINGMMFCAKCYQETFGKQEDLKTAHYSEHLEQENAQLKQQLAEKDEKIKSLTFNLKEKEMEFSVMQDFIKRNTLAFDKLRHEICEKIRNLAGDYFEFPICESCGETLFASSDVIMTGSDFEKILQEVEKGEE